jgi:FlaG/FlaF family flagellin (archaellin)
MKSLRRTLRDKKGINTILAALLMVVIVVVASVMVYAWSTGLLSSLLVQNPVPKETIQYDSFAYGAGSSTSNLTIFIRNSGSVAVTLQTYYVKDNSGNQYTSGSTWNSTSIAPNGASSVGICIVKQGTSAAGSCPAVFTGTVQPTYSGTGSGFTFNGGNSYTITVVTTRNNQFTWSFTK